MTFVSSTSARGAGDASDERAGGAGRRREEPAAGRGESIIVHRPAFLSS
jgi:hypothetical protein